MSYIDKEDWMHIDDYNKEVNQLEDQIAVLQKVIEDMTYDESYILSLVMGLRDQSAQRKEWETVAHCDHIVFLHSAVAQTNARKLMK